MYTLDTPHTFQEEIRKSRFIALAAPVQTAAQAMEFFARESIASATHNCWAYRLGGEYRFNDDGEPGGTAGRPILQAIEGQECDRVAVLVVRWFGGIKLGTGGLMRAYGGVAAQCLRTAVKIPIVAQVDLACSCPFSEMALVQSRLPGFGATVVDESFDAQGVNWRLRLPQDEKDEFVRAFTDLTRGRGQLHRVGDKPGSPPSA